MNNGSTATSTPSAPSIPGDDQRLGTLVGDRLCTGCGFNLVGQTIVRERHYNMLMVRCPECGTAAAMLEYPLLGKWANRWARVLAAGLIVLLIAVLLGSSLITWGVAHFVTEPMVQPLADRFGKAHWEWQQKNPQQAIGPRARARAASIAALPPPPAPSPPTNSAPAGTVDPSNDAATTPAPLSAETTPGAGDEPSAPGEQDPPAAQPQPVQTVATPAVAPPATAPPAPTVRWWNDWIDDGWHSTADLSAIAREAGWVDHLDWRALKWLIAALPAEIAIGVVWSTLVLAVRRVKLAVVVPTLVLMLAGLWATIEVLEPLRSIYASTRDLALHHVGGYAYLITYACFATGLGAGVLIGRSVARFLIRVMLPPRLCGSLSDLWLCDGLRPPYGALAGRRV